jgi:hypothetical protein
MSTFLQQNVAFAPKYTKVRDIGFVIGKEFVGGLLEEAMQIEPVYGVASCFTASDQNRSGVLNSPSIILAMSISVMFFLSTTPFCCGV